VTEKYLDFSFEKTNSAYMLFYERRTIEKQKKVELLSTPSCSSQDANRNLPSEDNSMENDTENKISTINELKVVKRRSLLSKDLEDWIWQDNRHYLEDRNIFEHTYFK
jgi:ubiquitin carboxyl-terminal hydrolase 34